MITHDLKLGELDLELRFDNMASRKIEKSLGKNIMTLFETTEGGIPLYTTDELLTVIQGANKTRPSYNINQITKAFDEQEELKSFKLFTMVLEMMEEDGFLDAMTE